MGKSKRRVTQAEIDLANAIIKQRNRLAIVLHQQMHMANELQRLNRECLALEIENRDLRRALSE